jgi:hypothetical protein
VFAELDETPHGKTCDAIVGIVEEGQELIKEYGELRLWTRVCLRPPKQSSITKSPATGL